MGPFVRDTASVPNEEVVVPCPCEGTPHDRDIVYIRAYFSGAEVAKIQAAMFTIDDDKPDADLSSTNLMAMELGVTGWSFVDGEGNPIPFDPHLTNLMRGDIWKLVMDKVDTKTDAAKSPLGVTPSFEKSSKRTSHRDKSATTAAS